nr:hypothetical protein [Tissierella sp.]
MSVIIKRNTGWNGVASKIQVKLNGEKVGNIMEKKQLEVEVPEGKSNLEVTRLGNMSDKIIVEDGDVVEIRSTEFYRKSVYLALPVSLIIGIIITLIPNPIYKVIISAAYLIAIAIFQKRFKLFNIKIVSSKTS